MVPLHHGIFGRNLVGFRRGSRDSTRILSSSLCVRGGGEASTSSHVAISSSWVLSTAEYEKRSVTQYRARVTRDVRSCTEHPGQRMERWIYPGEAHGRARRSRGSAGGDQPEQGRPLSPAHEARCLCLAVGVSAHHTGAPPPRSPRPSCHPITTPPPPIGYASPDARNSLPSNEKASGRPAPMSPGCHPTSLPPSGSCVVPLVQSRAVAWPRGHDIRHPHHQKGTM